MTKQELIAKAAEAAKGTTQVDAKLIIEAAFAAIKAALKEEGRFSFPEFGTFTVRERAARMGKNPQTGATIKIAASKTVGFKPSPSFKEMLMKKKAAKKK